MLSSAAVMLMMAQGVLWWSLGQTLLRYVLWVGEGLEHV